MHPLERLEQRLRDHGQQPVVGGALEARAGRRQLRLELRSDEQLLVELRLRAGGDLRERAGRAQQIFVVLHLQLIVDTADSAGGTIADTK